VALELELQTAIALAKEAGKVVVELRDGGLSVEMKPGDEPVTVADRTASEMIIRGLAKAFPTDPVISEELPATSSQLQRKRLWLVDPIDGTKDFIKGGDGFAVMIGLLVDHRPVLGVVHQPSIERTFFATPDGAFVDVDDLTTRLVVSKVAKAAEARLVASASHRGADIDRVKTELGIAEEMNVGSVGVKLCLIANGARDLYVKTKSWDTCAPEAILAGAGGRLSDLFGDPIEYTEELAHRRGLVASNGHVHAEVVSKLGPLFASLRSPRP